MAAPRPAEKKGEVNELLTLLRAVNSSKEAVAVITKRKRECLKKVRPAGGRCCGAGACTWPAALARLRACACAPRPPPTTPRPSLLGLTHHPSPPLPSPRPALPDAGHCVHDAGH